MFWHSISVKQLVFISFKAILCLQSIQLLKNCLHCMHRRCIYRYYRTLKVDLASPPHKLFMSIAHVDQAHRPHAKIIPPLSASIYCLNPCTYSHRHVMLISCLCSDDGRPIASSLTIFFVDGQAHRSSCLGSAHFTYKTTISSISSPFLPSFYAD